jgi:hypothetical protein
VTATQPAEAGGRHQLASGTMTRETRPLLVHGHCVGCWAAPCAGTTTQHTHPRITHHLVLDIGACLNHLVGTWGNFLFSHRACSSPLQEPPVQVKTSACTLLDVRPCGRNQDKLLYSRVILAAPTIEELISM